MLRFWLLFVCTLALASATVRAAVNVTFDHADSNIGAGLYAFTLSGAVQPATFNSTFDVFNWFLLGNTLNPLQDQSAPSGWNVTGPNDINNAQWFYQNTAGLVNGVFEVIATPNLHGTLSWRFADSGHSENVSGTVTITSVPEPASYAKASAALMISSILGFGTKGFRRLRVKASWLHFLG